MKFKNFWKACVLISIMVLNLNAAAQSFDSVMLNYQSRFTQERTYFHYDRSSYYPGETIWFKAYLMEGIFPTEGSKSLYVDWVNESGSVISHTVYPILESGSHGSFEIPADFTGKQIHVRAYTKWMLNFDTSFIYSKTIPVLSKKIQTEKISPQVTSLQFFPEGGDVVAGLKNRIAFKASDQWGKPVKVSGVVVNDKNVFIDSIKTIHDGMGYFFIEPQQGVSYTAKWKDEKGASFTTALPEIKKMEFHCK